METTRTAIVTGASRGIGREVARHLIDTGFDVLVVARTAGPLEELSSQAKHQGRRALPLALDLADGDSWGQVIDTAREAFGRIDALVNNAAMLDPIGHLADVDLGQFVRNIRVSFLSVVALTRSAIPELRATGGRVINVTSTAVGNPVVGMSAYSSAKAGIEQLATVVAAEEPDLTILTVKPGLVDTRMHERLRDQPVKAMSEERLAYFQALADDGQLLDPVIPGRAIAILAAAAPREWSGSHMGFDDPEVRALVADR